MNVMNVRNFISADISKTDVLNCCCAVLILLLFHSILTTRLTFDLIFVTNTRKLYFQKFIKIWINCANIGFTDNCATQINFHLLMASWFFENIYFVTGPASYNDLLAFFIFFVNFFLWPSER